MVKRLRIDKAALVATLLSTAMFHNANAKIFKIEDRERFIELLLSIIRGINVFLLPDKNEDEIDDYANHLVSMVIAYIKK